jgi:DNA polymerase I-like protein with 3'-5' exonuclease and polymerase domains
VTERVNSPTQGTEADGAKRALALLWQRRAEVPSARPVLFNHDEIVVEVDEGEAETAKGWLVRALLDGMAPLIAPVPVRVDAKVGPSWGD